MKIGLYLQDVKIDYYTMNLCSYGDHGDFELFPHEELDLNLFSYEKQWRMEDVSLDCMTEEVAFLKAGRVDVTLYRSGRMILESVMPDDEREAIRIGKKILGLRERD